MKKLLTGIIALATCFPVFSQVDSMRTNTNTNSNTNTNTNGNRTNTLSDKTSPQKTETDYKSNAATPDVQQQTSRADAAYDDDAWMRDMNFSDAQNEQLRMIDDDINARMETLKSNKSLTEQQMREQKMAIKQDRNSRRMALMTPEQKSRYETYQSNMKSGSYNLDEMRTSLGLTDAQYSKLQELNAAFEKREMEMNNATMSDADRSTKRDALRAEKHKAFKSILTADQVKKIDMDKDGYKIKTVKGDKKTKIKSEKE